MTARVLDVDAVAPAGSGASPRDVRLEIQALRALAVLGVVLFHLWPSALPGGFVGVDVFFVLSGFLITDHLMRELNRTNSISLPRFWARRIRRLLPASFATIAATAVGVYTLVPASRWPQFGQEIIASGFYVENWYLAWQSVDYMALSNVKSPSQHFWSLGVEEQFYVVWPLLLLLAAWLATRMKKNRRAVAAGALVAVAVASLIHSVSYSSSDPGPAYFFTSTRVWEFAAGGILALWLSSGRVALRPRAASVVSWAGIACVIVSMVTYGPATPFPSYTAMLPVVGTCLVIVAGMPSVRWAPSRVMAVRPVQFVGDVSYGVYLWHWPLIILIPYALGAPLPTWLKVIVLAASIALGFLSKKLVEDPIRRHRVVTQHRPRWTFAVTAAAMALTMVAVLPMARWTAQPVPAPEPTTAGCLGAMAMLDAGCGDVTAAPLIADPTSFAQDLPPSEIIGCSRAAESGTYARCEFGDPSAPRRYALLGDSHAVRLVEPLGDIARERDHGLSTFLINGCAAVAREEVGTVWGMPDRPDLCRETSAAALDEIAADESIDVVILNNRTRLYLPTDPADLPLTAEQVADTISLLQAAQKQVIVLEDTPEMHETPPREAESASDCLLRTRDVEACALRAPQAEFADPMRAAAEMTGAGLLSLNDLFCDDDLCLPQVGGLIVYSDDNHLTRSFAGSLRGPLGERLDQALADQAAAADAG
ncbi:acyltransferase [Microbacterium sp. CFH 90308]|uniref:Acyltransferase n=1 Tax=Microbacterium salsuginis TaxID=2722803 RepID=A0ABX1KA65_9MICO|nr:acyltransferase [Microbacterium sp. CFH 90308]